MLGRVALEHHAWRPPRLLALKIAQAHAATRTECHGIIEDLPDLGMPRGGIGAVLFEPYDRSSLPQSFVRRMRIAQEIERERIDLANRNPIGWAPFRGGLQHGAFPQKSAFARDAIMGTPAFATSPTKFGPPHQGGEPLWRNEPIATAHKGLDFAPVG